MCCSQRLIPYVLPVLLLVLGANVQAQETEPNNSCSDAQEQGLIPLPTTIIGELNYINDVSDVDFFRIQATPGEQLQADLAGVSTGVGTLQDPFLGAFDSNCAELEVRNDGGIGYDARVIVEVPDNGVIILGVTTCCDNEFDGVEYEAVGSYVLTIDTLRLIGSVYGRLVDAFDGSPLLGDKPPYPYPTVELRRCSGVFCDLSAIAIESPDEFGGFSFDGVSGQLTAGVYRLVGYAAGYRQSTSTQFTVNEFDNIEFGDFAITPFPIQFGAVQTCEILMAGEVCKYGIELTNQQPDRYQGEAWSTMQLFGPEVFFQKTSFQVGKAGTSNPKPQRLNLKQGQSEILEFQFRVPSNVPEGSGVCASIAVGSKPYPQFSGQGEQTIFCANFQSDGNAVVLQ